YKAAHALVARAVRAAIESGAATLTPELLNAASDQGDPVSRLDIALELIAEALDPTRIVAARLGLGGAGDAPMQQMIAECRQTLADHTRWRETAEAGLAGAEALLLMTATSLKTAPALLAEKEQAVAQPPKRSPQSLEDLVDDLPPPPNRRPWRL
ncbi:MAG: hypothetical protein ACRDH2_10940, partial [Anaerolineales bacterium]